MIEKKRKRRGGETSEKGGGKGKRDPGSLTSCTWYIFPPFCVLELIVLLGQGLLEGLLLVPLELLAELVVNDKLGGLEGGGGGELEVGVTNELAGEPEEGLLKVVVGLGADVVVLEVLLAVEGDVLGLHLAVLDVDLVTAEDDGDVVADTDQILVPGGDVLVGDAGGDIEHDDGALAIDVVAVTETTELLLSGSVPGVEDDGATVGGEVEGVNLHSEGGHVLLLKLTSHVALHEGGLAGSTISNQHKLEGRDNWGRHCDMLCM